MYIWLPVRNHGSRNLAVQRRLALGFANDEAEHLADEELAGRDENRPIAQSDLAALVAALFCPGVAQLRHDVCGCE